MLGAGSGRRGRGGREDENRQPVIVGSIREIGGAVFLECAKLDEPCLLRGGGRDK
jgi:hypothetical protein